MSASVGVAPPEQTGQSARCASTVARSLPLRRPQRNAARTARSGCGVLARVIMSDILTGRNNPTILRQETTAVKFENLGGLTKRTFVVNAILIPAKHEIFSFEAREEVDFSRRAECDWSPSFFQIPGHIDHRHLFQSAEVQVSLDNGRGLVVQEVVVPPSLHQFGDNNRNGPAWVGLLEVAQELHERSV